MGDKKVVHQDLLIQTMEVPSPSSHMIPASIPISNTKISNADIVFHPIHSEITHSGTLFYFDTYSKKWKKRIFRFDGRHFVCLRRKKYSKAQQVVKEDPELLTSIHCDQDTPFTTEGKMLPYPSPSFIANNGSFQPNLFSSMFASYDSEWEYLTSNQSLIKANHYQAPKFIIDLWKVNGISVVSRKLPEPTITIKEFFGMGKNQRKSVNYMFVIHCPERNLVLKAMDHRDFEKWIFILSQAVKSGQENISPSVEIGHQDILEYQRGRLPVRFSEMLQINPNIEPKRNDSIDSIPSSIQDDTSSIKNNKSSLKSISNSNPFSIQETVKNIEEELSFPLNQNEHQDTPKISKEEQLMNEQKERLKSPLEEKQKYMRMKSYPDFQLSTSRKRILDMSDDESTSVIQFPTPNVSKIQYKDLQSFSPKEESNPFSHVKSLRAEVVDPELVDLMNRMNSW